MNIFILDKDLDKSATLMCDSHLRKQILELAQIICTVKALEGVQTPYRPTHKHHPVTKWAQIPDNFQFCLSYNWLILGREYQHRFNKKHKSATILINYYDEYKPSVSITPFPIRNGLDYYQEKLAGWLERPKPLVAKWTNRPVPEWYKS